MFDSELAQRAGAFGAILAAMTRKEPSPPRPTTPAADLQWAAASFVAELLSAAQLIGVGSAKRLWLADSSLSRVSELHRAAHARMPPHAALPGGAPLTPHVHGGAAGFLLETGAGTHGGWLTEVLPVAAARHWSELVDGATANDDGARLARWLIAAGRSAFDAPAHLPDDHRRRLLDALLEFVLAHPSHVELAAEVGRRVRPGVRVPPLPRELTPTAIRTHLRDLERLSHRERPFSDPIAEAVAIVIRHDDGSTAGYASAFARIQRLVTESLTKPRLAELVGWSVGHIRPESIAWMLADVATAAFGIDLLRTHPLTEATFMDSWDARELRLHEQRLRVLRDAVAIVTRTIAAYAGPRESVAALLIEVLREFGEARTRHRLDDESSGRNERERNDEMLAVITDALGAARERERRGIGRPPALLESVLDAAVRRLDDFVSEKRPLLRVVVAHELLRLVHRTSDDIGKVRERAAPLASTIVCAYGDALTADAGVNEDHYEFFPRTASLVELPWELTVCVLLEAGQLRDWADQNSLAAPVLTSALSSHDQMRSALAGRAARLRAHLEVLLRARARVNNHRLTAASTRERAGEVLDAAIERIVDLRTDRAQGTVSVFDREINYGLVDAEIQRLAKLTAGSLTARAHGTIEGLVESTNDPLLLLELARSLPGQKHRERAAARLADPSVLERGADDFHLPSLVYMAIGATARRHGPLAARLRARGDEIPADHPHRAAWDREGFRMSLVEAVHARDRAAAEALVLPVSTTDSATRADLEESRTFHLALIDLETSPERARDSFREQRARRPDSGSISINLFAANLRVAKAEDDPDARRLLYEHALDEWRRHERTAFAGEVEPQATLNELLALDGAGFDAEMDRRWAALDSSLQTNLDIASARVANLDRRELHSEADRITEALRAVHGPGVELKSDGAPPAVRVDDRVSIEQHRRRWESMKALPPRDLASMFHPGSQVPIADEIEDAHAAIARALLVRLPSIAAIQDENRMNDLFVALLEQRLQRLGWSVHEQSRHASGERDWVVKRDTQELAIAEALRLDSVEKASIKEHLNKVITRYDAQGVDATLLLAYYEGPNFDGFCARYRDHLQFAAELAEVDGWRRLPGPPARRPSDVRKLDRLRIKYRRGNQTIVQDHVLIDLSDSKPTAAAGTVCAPAAADAKEPNDDDPLA